MIWQVAADVEDREPLGIHLKETPHGSNVQVPGVCLVPFINIMHDHRDIPIWVIYRDSIGCGTRQIGNVINTLGQLGYQPWQ